ncbi:MAG: hypothetical protein IVW57_03175 [Ktedonobacterales bacterium]|nr:hypothetical protein [Ktedonobacterales bacterium]
MQALIHSFLGTVGITSCTAVGLSWALRGTWRMVRARRSAAMAAQRRINTPHLIARAHAAFIADVERRLAEARCDGAHLVTRMRADSIEYTDGAPAAGPAWVEHVEYRMYGPLPRRSLLWRVWHRVLWGDTRTPDERHPRRVEAQPTEPQMAVLTTTRSMQRADPPPPPPLLHGELRPARLYTVGKAGQHA